MRFNNLTSDEKLQLQQKLFQLMEILGGKNYFLKMLEEIREASQHPLLNKTGKYHFSQGTITWKKQIFKEKIQFLKNIFVEYHDNNLLEIPNKKLQKEVINTINTLGKLTFEIATKENQHYSFQPFITLSETCIEIEPIFQILFFDSVVSTKKILDYK